MIWSFEMRAGGRRANPRSTVEGLVALLLEPDERSERQKILRALGA
jgi:hypothetical protein